jgi:hypothetical protein
MGATPEEWKSYQELSLDATQEAVAQLQARGLRDMKWLANAKSRASCASCRSRRGQAQGRRAEVTTEVRAQPVYAALRFLTHGELPEAHRSNAERKAPRIDRRAEDQALDPRSQSDVRRRPGRALALPERGQVRHVAAEDGVTPTWWPSYSASPRAMSLCARSSLPSPKPP